MKKLSLSILLLSLFTSCAHKQAFIVTGDALEELGNTFLTTANAFNQAYDDGTVTQEQYAKFKEFGLKFKQVYPAAVKLWELAVITNDALLQERSLAIVSELVGPLAEFSAEIMKIVHGVKQ